MFHSFLYTSCKAISRLGSGVIGLLFEDSNNSDFLLLEDGTPLLLE